MAYFALPSLTLPSYRFDYDSPFAGILPVEDPASVAGDALQLPVAYKRQGRDGALEVQATVAIAQGQQLSLAALFGGGEADDAQPGRGAVSLFLKALAWMEEGNPLAGLAARGHRVRYECGECVAEDLYIACVCLSRWLGLNLRRGIAATDPVLYKSVRGALEGLAKGVKPATSTTLDQLMPALRYFNRRVYGASRYTPRDDVYRARRFAIGKLRAEPDGEARYLQWMAMSLRYLELQGVAHVQAAIGEEDIRAANAVAASYNQARQTQYKLLAQTSSDGADAQALGRELSARILPLFEDPTLGEVIGIDLPGGEHEAGRYAESLAFLSAQLQVEPGPELTRFFGAGAGARALQLTQRIDCGPGTGVASDNRSMIGYAMAYSLRLPGTGFYRAYSDYVFACLAAAKGRQAEDAPGASGAPPHRSRDVSGLLDEMFGNDSLTCDGLTLRRYDLAGARTRARVDAAGQRSAMALCAAFDRPASAQGPSYYESLTANTSLLGFRLGQAGHYRSFIASKYPFVAFDTRPGGDAIVAAADRFAPAGDWRLDGYIDTDRLRAANERWMYAGAQALSATQIGQLMKLVRDAATLADLFVGGRPVLQEQLSAATALIASVANLDRAYAAFQALVEALVGDSPLHSVWFAALSRVLNLFINWRSYLLGSNAPGVEHSDIQDEFLRTVVLLAYELVPFDASAPTQASLGAQLQQLVASVSAAYWQATVGPLAGLAGTRQITAAIAGYKAPASVVTVTRKPGPA
ncbi:hypothetical protein [Lysobacter sp. 1R34A]|uniref:hypothetical protein n=1 Tax=Lysobacter sp. 1R34A TaxID=3445786 RepID=UPI003EEC27C5